MAMDPTPWLVGGGAEHPPEIARLIPYLANGGREGVGEPSDMKVTPLSTPGGGVAVAPGAVLVRNSNPGGGQQTYMGRNPATSTVDVQPTGSSAGRADMIAVVVRDPQYPGTSVPDDPTTARYIDVEVIQGVPSNARTAADAGLTFPAYPLARINLPANTGTVQASHITDLRQLVAPRIEPGEHIRVGDIGAQSLNTKNQTDGVPFPSVGGQHSLYIPEWASQMKVTFKWLDLEYLGTNTYGDRFVRVGSGSDAIDTHRYHFDAPHGMGRTTMNWEIVDVLAIPPALRGTTQRFEARAYLGQNATEGQVRIREASSTILEVEFRETLA